MLYIINYIFYILNIYIYYIYIYYIYIYIYIKCKIKAKATKILKCIQTLLTVKP